MNVDEVTIAPGEPEGAEARALVAELDAELATFYPPTSIASIDPARLVDDGGVFVIARLDGRAVGCGGLAPLAPGVGEVKRVYVRAQVRGRGIARRLMARLEEDALALGCMVLRLETGTRQPESIRLYEAAGYRRIPCFGVYADDPYSICYEKRLDGDA